MGAATDLLQRRRQMMAKRDLVPFQRLEWMSSDGRAYINTGIVPKDTPRVVLSVSVSKYVDIDVFGFLTNTTPSFIGNLDSPTDFGVQRFHYYRYYNTVLRAVPLSSVAYGEFGVWDLGYEVKCNGTTLATYNRESFENNTQFLYVFRGRNVASVYAKIAFVQVYDGDTLLRDFVPVRIGDVGYMYDKVTKQLFGNDGTGAFVLGPDIN